MELILIAIVLLIVLYFLLKKVSSNKIKYIISLSVCYLPFLLSLIIHMFYHKFNFEEIDFEFIYKLNFIHIIIKILHSLYFNILIDLSKKRYINSVRVLIMLIFIVCFLIFMRSPLEKDLSYYLCYCLFYVLIFGEFLLTFKRKNE